MRPSVNSHGGLRTGVSLGDVGASVVVCQALALSCPCLAEDKSDKGVLRPAKSMDSLSAAAGANDGERGCSSVCVGGVTADQLWRVCCAGPGKLSPVPFRILSLEEAEGPLRSMPEVSRSLVAETVPCFPLLHRARGAGGT